MGKLKIAPGGGGADLDVVTVTDPWDVAAGKVIVDKDGNPLTGTLTERGAWTGSVGMNGSVAIPDGRHKNSKVNGPVITRRGAVDKTINCGQNYNNGAGYYDSIIVTAASLASQTPGNLAANKMLAGTYGVSKGVRVDGNIASVGGPSIAPQTYAQAISVGGKYVTGNGNVAGVALPPAAALKKGYRYWIGNNYVDGNFQGYVDSPLYLYNNGTWSNLHTTGMLNGTVSGGNIRISRSSKGRLNQTVDLTPYKYLKISAKIDATSASYNQKFTIGVSTSSNASSSSYVAKMVVSGKVGNFLIGILDISALSGFYYIYVDDFLLVMTNANTYSEGLVNQIFLSTT